MSNQMSVELTEWAELASNVKSPIAYHLSSLLRSLSELTDDELLNTSINYTREKITVWNSLIHSYADALDLPEGKLIRCFSHESPSQVCIELDTLRDAVNSLKADPDGSFWEARTQAEIIGKAFYKCYTFN